MCQPTETRLYDWFTLDDQLTGVNWTTREDISMLEGHVEMTFRSLKKPAAKNCAADTGSFSKKKCETKCFVNFQ